MGGVPDSAKTKAGDRWLLHKLFFIKKVFL